MSQERISKGRIAKKILLVLGIIILVLAFIIFGGYFYLKYALKIDVLEIKRAVDLLNKPVNARLIVENGFDEEDSANVFFKLFQNENIYKNNGEEYVFDNDQYQASTIQSETILTDKELASLVNVFFQNEESDIKSVSKGILLKQLSFLSFDSTEQHILRIKYVVELDLTSLKGLTKESLLEAFSLESYIPQKLYFSCEQDIFIDLFYENFSSNNCNILINNLNSAESQTVLNVFSHLVGDDFESIKKDFAKVFPNVFFGDNAGTGIMQKVFGEGNFSFFVDEDDVVKLRVIP